MEGHIPARIENARILVVVKSYPRPSMTHGETACVAGLLDGTSWIRLYPVLFRQLPSRQRFDKWQWIRAPISKSVKDPRTESWQPDHDRLVVEEKIGTTVVEWGMRDRYLQNLTSDTIEGLKGDPHRSLGWVKPWRIERFFHRDEESRWDEKFQSVQLQFWGAPTDRLERIPYTFYVNFQCEPSCKGHNLSIIDWEIYQLYRKTRSSQKVIEKLNALHKNSDLSFFVGTSLKAHAYGAYMVIGLYYPPRHPPLTFTL